MKRNLATKLMGIILLCCILVTIIPTGEVKAETTYMQTLQFDTSYDIRDGGGCRQFDLVLDKSGCVTIKYLADSTDGRTRICVYDETDTNRLYQRDFSGSFKCDLNLKAGKYTLHVCEPWNGGCWGRTPATGTMIASYTDSKETYPETIIETNDEYGVASEVGTIEKQTIVGQFAINDSKDYYSFTVKGSKKVNITYATLMTSSKIHVYKDSLDLEYWEQNIAAGTHKYTYVLPEGKYYISVENNNKDITGNYTLNFLTSKLDSSKLKSVESSAKKTITVKYSKISTANKYQIQIAKDSKFTKSVKNYTTDTTSKKISNLSSKGTYYVRVRAITYANDYKCYSAWSSAKKIKVK